MKQAQALCSASSPATPYLTVQEVQAEEEQAHRRTVAAVLPLAEAVQAVRRTAAADRMAAVRRMALAVLYVRRIRNPDSASAAELADRTEAVAVRTGAEAVRTGAVADQTGAVAVRMAAVAVRAEAVQTVSVQAEESEELAVSEVRELPEVR